MNLDSFFEQTALLARMFKRFEKKAKKAHQVSCHFCYKTIQLDKDQVRLSAGLVNHWCGKCYNKCKDCGAELLELHGEKLLLDAGLGPLCVKGHRRGVLERAFMEGFDSTLYYHREAE